MYHRILGVFVSFQRPYVTTIALNHHNIINATKANSCNPCMQQTNTQNNMTDGAYTRPCLISHLCKIYQVPAYVWRNLYDAVAADGKLLAVKVVVEPFSPAR